ncbi:hypothetical protein VTI74DRAFT_1881 [Chaetomium olivicolor]
MAPRKVIDVMVMAVYYEMSLTDFIDNVVNIALDSCPIYGIPSILTLRKVGVMNVNRLIELVAESEDVQERRRMLQDQAKVLGLQKCNKDKPRERTASKRLWLLNKNIPYPELTRSPLLRNVSSLSGGPVFVEYVHLNPD